MCQQEFSLSKIRKNVLFQEVSFLSLISKFQTSAVIEEVVMDFSHLTLKIPKEVPKFTCKTKNFFSSRESYHTQQL